MLSRVKSDDMKYIWLAFCPQTTPISFINDPVLIQHLSILKLISTHNIKHHSTYQINNPTCIPSSPSLPPSSPLPPLQHPSQRLKTHLTLQPFPSPSWAPHLKIRQRSQSTPTQHSISQTSALAFLTSPRLAVLAGSSALMVLCWTFQVQNIWT